MSKFNFKYKQKHNSNYTSAQRFQLMFRRYRPGTGSQEVIHHDLLASQPVPDKEEVVELEEVVPIEKIKHPFKMKKKKLTDREIIKYKEMGKPDLSQNWLELFSPELIDDLFTAMHFGSDNYKKANYVIEMLKPFGFRELGEGTNIIVLYHPSYPGVVYKIALDSNGIADNFNDDVLQHEIPHYTRVFARHSSGIVSVQEYSVTMNQERMKDFVQPIMRLLKQLSKKYLVADLSPSRFLNFGVTRQGDFVIQDGSDLFPITQMEHKIRCQAPTGWDNKKNKMIRCGGKLEYSADFLVMRCKECGKEINPLELRPTSKEGDARMAQFMTDGLTADERLALQREELEAIRRRTQGQEAVRVERREEAEPPEQTSAEEDIGETPYGPDEEKVDVRDEPVFENTEPEPENDEEEEEDIPKIEDSGYTNMIPDSKILPKDLADRIKDMEDDDNEDEDEPEEIPDQPVETHESLSNKIRDLVASSQVDHSTIEIKAVAPDPEDEDDTEAGIYITVHGDFDKAWDKCGVPLYVSIDNSRTFNQVLSSQAMKKLIGKFIEDLKAEADEDE